MPSSNKLEIGQVSYIVCEFENVENWLVVTLARKQLNDTKYMIGNMSKTDQEITYGNGRGSHMSISLEDGSTENSANVTLSFDVVQCDDNAVYFCTVESALNDVRTSEPVDVFSKLLKINKILIFPCLHIRTVTSENVHSDICAQGRLRSAWAFVQSDQNHVLKYVFSRCGSFVFGVV